MAPAQALPIGHDIQARLQVLLMGEARQIKIEPFTELGRLHKQIVAIRGKNRIAADQLEAMLMTLAGDSKAAKRALDNAYAIGMPKDMYAQNCMMMHSHSGDFSQAHAATEMFLETTPDHWATNLDTNGICAIENADLLEAALDKARALCNQIQQDAWGKGIDEVLGVHKLLLQLSIPHQHLLYALDAIGSVLHQAGYLVHGSHIGLQLAKNTHQDDDSLALYCTSTALSPKDAAELDDAISDLVASDNWRASGNPILPFILSSSTPEANEQLAAS